ncbi:MAG: selenide, water dikinase SelD [Pseudomonadales bacterium]|nr:selenide, water dikinase SelD [Pseudomonadales bacterium]MCP5183884.1 selenide, water dikinase SelD [Pseudomonadales bacterium]
MHTPTPPVRDLVLLGGGHAHVQVLRRLVDKPLHGVRVTVVSREVASPYSGMLPGHVAGFYTDQDLLIDLLPLARQAGARLLLATVDGIDLGARQVRLAGHPPLRFDWLSLNTGALPRPMGAGVSVKPIDRFLPAWSRARDTLKQGASVAVVGGGAAGVELVLAIHRARPDLVLSLVARRWMPDFPAGAARRLRSRVESVGVAVREGLEVTDFVDGRLRYVSGDSLAVDEVFWVTDVQAPTWLAASGLDADPRGFVRVDPTLRSVSHPEVFAVGDVACLVGQERPKAGVYAVRAGPVLSHNLRAVAMALPLRRYRPQQDFLRLVGTSDGSAVASKWGLSWSGAAMWRWKDRIDRRFMAMFRMPPMPSAAPASLPAALRADAPEPMRCGGCGAKLGADLLARVLRQLPIRPRDDVLLGIGDDAAEVRTGDSVLVTTDGLRAMVDDPYLFGRLVTHHNLNDLFAMGAVPTSAVALATVPLMAQPLMEAELLALLRGVVDVLEAHDVPLVGGHSAEGAELFLGLTLTGRRGAVLLRKSGLVPGQHLITTKPLGTGVVLAAAMRGLPVGAPLASALASMDTSNARAVAILIAHGARAATDVTGFGLLGHLAEMLRASGTGATLRAASIPLLDGARALFESGIRSSLQPNNEQALADFVVAPGVEAGLLCDPQTAGGLLAGIPAERSAACLAALRAAGYAGAAIIGDVTPDTWRLN